MEGGYGDLRQWVNWRAERAKLANARREQLDGEIETCFAISRLTLLEASFEFDDLATLRPVRQPPVTQELEQALAQPGLASAIGRHMSTITYELAVRATISADPTIRMNLGRGILSALQCRSASNFVIPAAASVSWDSVAAFTDRSVNVVLCDDVPQARSFGKSQEVSLDALCWVRTHLLAWCELRSRPAFGLAVDSLMGHHLHSNQRMAVAEVWAGIEAIFQVSTELRFRIAALAAAYLEPRGSRRLAAYKRYKSLYDFRSKVVHGQSVNEAMIEAHVIEVRELLSRLVCRISEAGALPTTNDFEERLFI